jgi:hypothetical protein
MISKGYCISLIAVGAHRVALFSTDGSRYWIRDKGHPLPRVGDQQLLFRFTYHKWSLAHGKQIVAQGLIHTVVVGGGGGEGTSIQDPEPT